METKTSEQTPKYHRMTPDEEKRLAAHWATLGPRFKVTVIPPEFRGCKEVRLAIFRPDMTPEDGAELLGGITDDPYVGSTVEGTFSGAEVGQLLSFFASFYKGSKVEVKGAPPPSCGETGWSATAVGGETGFYCFDKTEGYLLPFKIWGYYDLRQHEPAHWRLAIKRCVAYIANPCAFCGLRIDAEDFGLYLEDSPKPVCWDCGQKHEPDLVELLEVKRIMNRMTDRLEVSREEDLARIRQRGTGIRADDLPF